MADAPIAESSPAAPVSPPDLASLSKPARDHWRLTGEFPSTTPAESPDPSSTPPPDSSPAEPAAQVASAEAQVSPASEPGTPTTRKSNADSRKAELKAEIDSLLAERARIRAEVEAERSARSQPATPPTPPQAASSPATADAPFPTYDQWIAADQARLNSPDSYQDYQDARADHRWSLKERAAAARQAEQTRQQQFETRKQEMIARLKTASDANPEFLAKLDPRWQQAVPVEALPPGTTPHALNVIAQEVFLSEHGPAMMAHLSAHPTEFDRLLSFQTQDQIVRAMGRLEAQLSSATPQPVVKTTTSAPPPAPTLGSKPAGGIEDSRAAVAAGDFSRYKATMNRQEVAR